MNENKWHVKCFETAKRQNTDDTFGKTECVDRQVYDCRVPWKKGKNFQNWEKNCIKKWEPQTNRVKMVSVLYGTVL